MGKSTLYGGRGVSIEFSLAVIEMWRCPNINDEDCLELIFQFLGPFTSVSAKCGKTGFIWDFLKCNWCWEGVSAAFLSLCVEVGGGGWYTNGISPFCLVHKWNKEMPVSFAYFVWYMDTVDPLSDNVHFSGTKYKHAIKKGTLVRSEACCCHTIN